MSRKAILIESSNIRGEVDLPGARADVVNLDNYLRSEVGGGWYGDEIVVLHKPDRLQVKVELAKAKIADYAFVAFSGHGDHVQGRTIDETRICLSEGQEIGISELDPGNDRCLVLADSCRKVVRLLEAAAPEMVRKMAFAHDQRLLRSRMLFDQAVSSTEKGKIVMYSCDLDESADEPPSGAGGLFTLLLLGCARQWADQQQRDAVLNAYQVFQWAQEATTKANSRQHPKYYCGRRRYHFPFAVHVE